ncbi:MAG: hypothetical protein AB7K41_14700 [Bdellovibrionales bacterium]
MIKALFILVFSMQVQAQSPTTNTAKDTAKADKIEKSATKAEDDILSALDYPELQVVPRASERLQMESQLESERGWLAFWPFNLSALMTLGVGYTLSGDYKEDADDDQKNRLDFLTQAATGVGVGWMALSTYYIFTRPYGGDAKKIRAIPGRDRRSDLLRERLAEEALEKPARLVRIFTWMSCTTNFVANAALLGRSTSGNDIYPLIGLLGSMLPLVFNNRYVENYDKHLEYKRKIYAPVAFVNLRRDYQTARYEPQMVMQWSF